MKLAPGGISGDIERRAKRAGEKNDFLPRKGQILKESIRIGISIFANYGRNYEVGLEGGGIIVGGHSGGDR